MDFTTFDYRFADEILSTKYAKIKKEVESIIKSIALTKSNSGRKELNAVFKKKFEAKGWTSEPRVFEGPHTPLAKLDFIKDRVGVEVEFGHSSFIGVDLLKLQTSSYSHLDKIDIGIYITTTKKFKKKVTEKFSANWEGSLDFEKVKKYLPEFKSAIQVPVWVVGLGI
jgi:hypothetical protein